MTKVSGGEIVSSSSSSKMVELVSLSTPTVPVSIARVGERILGGCGGGGGECCGGDDVNYIIRGSKVLLGERVVMD